MTSRDKLGPGDENPNPEGPEGEKVGDRDEERAPSTRRGLPSTRTEKDLLPIPGPGAPMVPDHQNIDSNPIDPRVF